MRVHSPIQPKIDSNAILHDQMTISKSRKSFKDDLLVHYRSKRLYNDVLMLAHRRRDIGDASMTTHVHCSELFAL